MPKTEAEVREVVGALFDQYDYNKNGVLEFNEVKCVLEACCKGRTWAPSDLERFFQGVDSNGDGKISKEELYEVFKKLMG
jgi:Ca2+-binding EF-hand superfamily protein